MPHIWVEYSANLEPELDIHRFMKVVQEASVGDGKVFPFAGTRIRAVPISTYLIADGHPDNAFVHVEVKIGHGRAQDEKEALCDRVFAAIRSYLAPIRDSRPLGTSMQVEEADPVLNQKDSNYRDYLKRRAT